MSTTQVTFFTFNPFQENTYVISDEHKNCIIIDPGCYERHEHETLIHYIESNKLKPLALLSTHAHIDHVLGNAFFMEHYQLPYYLHEADLTTLNSVKNYAHLYGFVGYNPSPDPTHNLVNDQELVFGSIRLKVYHTPGHAPGHVVFYNQADQYVINGDVLFKGSFGRVDLPGGDLATLKNSIHQILFKFPEETIVYAGHGESTTIGEEKKNNYILNF